ncbi:MAG: tRNA adenosine(34) deaminase TadA [Planctomycetes bacterium]|nr:tRNA adenosine(34) deaminase TadA [Planctomycetota bacterium]
MNTPKVSELWVPDEGSARDEHFMGIALRAAAEAYEREEVPVGAVIVLGQRVLSIASNRCEELHDPTAHAEMLAVTEACSVLDLGRLVDCEVYCTLEPCFMCAGALLHARIARIVFGARDPKFGACRSLATLPEDERLNHRCSVTEGVHKDVAADLMRAFFRERRGGNEG